MSYTFNFYLVLSAVQSEKSQAYNILIKESQYGLTRLVQAVPQAVQWGTSDAVDFGTHSSVSSSTQTTEGELQKAQAPIPPCYW